MIKLKFADGLKGIWDVPEGGFTRLRRPADGEDIEPYCDPAQEPAA